MNLYTFLKLCPGTLMVIEDNARSMSDAISLQKQKKNPPLPKKSATTTNNTAPLTRKASRPVTRTVKRAISTGHIDPIGRWSTSSRTSSTTATTSSRRNVKNASSCCSPSIGLAMPMRCPSPRTKKPTRAHSGPIEALNPIMLDKSLSNVFQDTQCGRDTSLPLKMPRRRESLTRLASIPQLSCVDLFSSESSIPVLTDDLYSDAKISVRKDNTIATQAFLPKASFQECFAAFPFSLKPDRPLTTAEVLTMALEEIGASCY